MLFVISKCIFRKRIIIGGKAVNFEAAGLAVFLFIIGKVMDTLLKVMSCQSVGSQSVHFYFGFEDCRGTTWFLSLFVLMFIAMSFGAVFVCARNLTMEQRADPNRFINKLAKRFKARYWYWEFVIFVRRLIIAYFAVGASEMIEQMVFIMVIMVFIGIQWKMTPFISSETNQAEFILLCGLPIVITAKILSVTTDDAFPTAFLSAMVLLPVPVMILYAVRIVMKEHQRWKSGTAELPQSVHHHIEIQSHSVKESDCVSSAAGEKRTETPFSEPTNVDATAGGSVEADEAQQATELKEIDDLVSDIVTAVDMDTLDIESEIENDSPGQQCKI